MGEELLGAEYVGRSQDPDVRHPVVGESTCVSRFNDAELCENLLKNVTSKDVSSMTGCTESFDAESECIDAASVSGCVSGSILLCPGEEDASNGNTEEGEGLLEDICDEKSQNLINGGRVRRSNNAILSRILIFEQAKRGGETKSEADVSPRRLKSKGGWK